MQNLTIIGRLGRDAQIKATQNLEFITFSVASNSRVKGVEKTTWYEVICFNLERYKNMIQYFTKGSCVVVSGELDASCILGKNGQPYMYLNIQAEHIEFGPSNAQNSDTTSASAENGSTDGTILQEVKVTAEAPIKKPAVKKTVEATNDDESLPF